MFTLFVWYVLIGVYTFLSMSLLVFLVIQRAFFIPFIGASRFYIITYITLIILSGVVVVLLVSSSTRGHLFRDGI